MCLNLSCLLFIELPHAYLLLYSCRDQGDIAQVHRQQKQLVSELKNVQTRRQTSFDDNANSLYRTEHDIQVSSSAHEPEAYTGQHNMVYHFDQS